MMLFEVTDISLLALGLKGQLCRLICWLWQICDTADGYALWTLHLASATAIEEPFAITWEEDFKDMILAKFAPLLFSFFYRSLCPVWCRYKR